jgi:hypothetical protein
MSPGCHAATLTQFTLVLLLVWHAGARWAIAAGFETTPVEVLGNVRFSNASTEILNLLGPPGNQGLNSLVAFATGTTSPQTASSGLLTATGPTQTDYRVVVDTIPGGIEYQFTYTLYVSGTLGGSHRGTYQLRPGPTATVLPGPAVTGVNAAECVGVMRVRLVNAAGEPVSASGGTLIATELGTGLAQADLFIRPGSPYEDFIVRGNTRFRITATVTLGSGDSAVNVVQTAEATSSCDGIVPLDIVVPATGSFGSIRGQIDMVGEFEDVFGDASIGDPALTRVVAYGPWSNVRTDTLPGVNFTVESSGPFTLPNLLPSTFTTPVSPYRVEGEMALRRFRQFEYFKTPALGVGMNAAPAVTAGAVTDLASTFVMRPGYLEGRVTLAGPPESAADPSYRSPLRGVIFSTDGTVDGIPVRSIYGNYFTAITAKGVDSHAFGTRHTAAGGLAVTSFDGAYDSSAGQWLGNYEQVLAGLDGEDSFWRSDVLSLTLRHGSPADPENYVSQDLAITDHRITDQLIVPGSHVTLDRRYEFGQVCVRIHSTAGPFWGPRLGDGSHGGNANYDVAPGASGTPVAPEMAATEGLLVVFLPEGSYHLVPRLQTASDPTGQDYIQLAPLDIEVRPFQQQCITPCLRVNYELPRCAITPSLLVTGTVPTSCGNKVDRIAWSLDGGPETTLCTGCGLNPSFSFEPHLPSGDCVDHVITVSANDSSGAVASNSQHIRLDSRPPVIVCLNDTIVGCEGPDGTQVDYPMPTASDNCPGPVQVTCAPPPGSRFTMGTTAVLCTAIDSCGNAAQCSFSVTVRDTDPPLIQCPGNVIVECSAGGSAVVSFAATAWDTCDGPLVVGFDHPSGSSFPVGTNSVVACARDSFGNQACCEFEVIVRPARVAIETAICVRWECGMLQSSVNADGPWEDMPGAVSPYYAPTRDGRRFYRVR